MPRIILTTLNARYSHASFGLRYLLANMGELRAETKLLEFTLENRPLEIAEKLLAESPVIIGIGVYIWNAQESRELVALLKAIRPELIIVLGGPEVSYEYDQQEIVQLADYTITGEADLAFAALCRDLLQGLRPPKKILPAPLPTMEDLVLPYDEYTDDDIAHRVLYVEASRGCPFKCEFCLSSLDIPVRKPPLVAFLASMERLSLRGVTQFKFVDRTFNLNIQTSLEILRFFQARYKPGLFLHFEMIPDRLPESLRDTIAAFPEGVLQFEVGVQTFAPEVSARIQRKQRYDLLEDNFKFLREKTGVHIHADLIIGLPGEDMESFGQGFDKMLSLGPQEIQVGILKRLRGTPIVRHDVEWQMKYSPLPPYEILSNKQLDFTTLQRLRRFARGWDLVCNSGNFVQTASLLWGEGSPFARFLVFSDWLFEKAGRTHNIALLRLAQLVFTYLTEVLQQDRTLVAQKICADYTAGGRHDLPEFLRGEAKLPRLDRSARTSLARQDRHAAAKQPESRS
jgi:radical SAM superfamily enzyme YgiQ (UPF0313 family)